MIQYNTEKKKPIFIKQIWYWFDICYCCLYIINVQSDIEATRVQQPSRVKRTITNTIDALYIFAIECGIWSNLHLRDLNNNKNMKKK